MSVIRYSGPEQAGHISDDVNASAVRLIEAERRSVHRIVIIG